MEIDLDEANLKALGLLNENERWVWWNDSRLYAPSTSTHTFHTINAKNFQLLQHESHHKATA